jgi:mRNA interferase RelE/StbE
MYSVILAQKARKFYAKAEVSLAQKIARCFQILEQDPRKHPNIKPLTGKLQGRYRYRIGDYRVIYRSKCSSNCRGDRPSEPSV